MVVPEAEMNNNSQGEVESPVIQVGEQQGGKNNHHPFSSIGRQSSIYSLTLDEFQHTLCESGKNFGSMNMDEFLSSIWNAEENQAIVNSSNNITNNNNNNTPVGEASSAMMREQQQSLHRQGSLTIPAPLSRKTVEEVWSEIHNKGEQTQQQQQQQHQQSKSSNSNGGMHTETTYRQPTFGEMTLEDFLVKAGVVREQCAMPGIPPPLAASHHHHHPHHQQQQYGVYSGNNSAAMAPSSFVGRTIIGGAGGVVAAATPYQAEPSGYPGSSCKRDGGGGAYPTPGSAGGVCYGEKVVERRQRRMIKNRESAARSRARKQAYTVELEAELNQLREENAQLKQALAEFEKRRKQQCCEEMNVRVQTKAQKATEKLRALRRNQSCPL
ncbi:protein ABSCISIC ACID-INSENSITIVE 5 [Arachis ipaensis]|uniref:protein ABSCISIC ACID-INSENSITIVE 5 n=1 Tax=Arachis ipaensis TaxID=130454 RepID=UPI0007AFE019|nr:protein ABSCISIC ACID-INSENSITIVE 5 [Arachis ipaensis]XP_016208143.1 protein ABSCISIC ACID-INSENSITIVE 5 [Arachis ipaensis]XP_016208144.1 protein ABSCISIC ACID-INSENSITIVE 5 [Arachis ipaensis]XP_020960229.1 protein ABSCISIC ACID-INSENSITIVE 5 [Arachis ipaensis]